MEVRLVFLALALPLVASAAVAQTAPPSPINRPAAGAETKDRMSNEDMRALVRRPVDEILSGEVARGERDFEALLQARSRDTGPASVEVADTITAMGVTLYSDARDQNNDAMKRKSVAYLARAITAARAAFGPDHPEVALALNDYADVERKIDHADPPPDVESSLEEAYRIRLAALGPWNAETGATLAYLGQVKGLPSRTKGDAGKVAQAAALLSRAIEIANHNLVSKPGDPAWMYLSLAYLYVANHSLPRALSNFSKSEALYNRLADTDESARSDLIEGAAVFWSMLLEQGYKQDAEALRKRYVPDAGDQPGVKP